MRVLTLTEAAKEAGISRTSIYQAVHRNRFPHTVDPDTKHFLVNIDDVLEWRHKIDSGELDKERGLRTKERWGSLPPSDSRKMRREFEQRRARRAELRTQGYMTLADVARIEVVSRQAVSHRYKGVPFIAVGSKKFVTPIIRAKHVAAYTAYYKGIGLAAPVMATPAGEGD